MFVQPVKGEAVVEQSRRLLEHLTCHFEVDLGSLLGYCLCGCEELIERSAYGAGRHCASLSAGSTCRQPDLSASRYFSQCVRPRTSGTGPTVEPIPETAALIEEFGTFYDRDLLEELKGQAEAVRKLVPDLVGLSLAASQEGIAFTLVASAADVAVLDAVQYIVGGPCVESPQAEKVLEYDCDVADELRWQTFARATAARAVATTLTLPVLQGGSVVGTVNLYAASAGAFRGLHREIAAVFGAWAPGAITNADLSFQTRRTAEEAPVRARAAMRIDLAVGMLIEAHSVDPTTARVLLEEAARRAGVNTEELAASLIEANRAGD